MKKTIFTITILVCFAMLAFVIVTKAHEDALTEEKALQIGVNKYLKFLWMVDGAFNSERMKEDFKVNGKELTIDDRIFTCKYVKAKDKECVGNNFESEFNNLFSSTISFEKVYSDGVLYSWISNKNGKYVFNDLDTCSINRMGINHELKVMDISNEKIIYEVLFPNNLTGQINRRDFVLIHEDNDWKISSAYYYDLCGMRYTIY